MRARRAVLVVWAFIQFQQWQSLGIVFKTVWGCRLPCEDLSAFGNYSGYCGTRSLLLNSFTNCVFNFVSIELIRGRREEGRSAGFQGWFTNLIFSRAIFPQAQPCGEVVFHLKCILHPAAVCIPHVRRFKHWNKTISVFTNLKSKDLFNH